jgi:hypothetical protein
MNLESDKWVAGIDYTAAPTCSTCHMSAAPNEASTHNVGERISWTLRPPVSTRINKEREYITSSPFDDKIEWTWWEIWHHEGRRARHGASMSGPDYTWWHGIYDVAKHTYFKWIPELKEVVAKKDGNDAYAVALLEEHFQPIEGHDWYFSGMGKDQIEEVRAAFEKRYGEGSLK